LESGRSEPGDQRHILTHHFFTSSGIYPEFLPNHPLFKHFSGEIVTENYPLSQEKWYEHCGLPKFGEWRGRENKN
jgi:hypothetical protein